MVLLVFYSFVFAGRRLRPAYPPTQVIIKIITAHLTKVIVPSVVFMALSIGLFIKIKYHKTHKCQVQVDI